MANNKFEELAHMKSSEFRSNVFEALPKLAVKFNEMLVEYSAISLNQEELPKPDAHFIKLHAKTVQICEEASKKIHSIEARILRQTSDFDLMKEPFDAEKLDFALKLTNNVADEVDKFWKELRDFHALRSFYLRKMLKYPDVGHDALDEFDRTTFGTIKIHLNKLCELIIIMQEKLAKNFGILSGKKEEENSMFG